ncbi:MAG: sigma 54-interacting transcriptional regulator [Calditrichia bacterium]
MNKKNSDSVEQKPPLQILLIGAGRAGSMLLRLFRDDPSLYVTTVIDVNPEAPGLEIARQWGIPVSDDYMDFLRNPDPDLIINVTGSQQIQEQLIREKPAQTELIGGLSAKLIWTLLSEFRKKEIEHGTFNVMRQELERLSVGEFIVGKNRKMQEVMELISRVAPTPTTVLIRGESGTGKELVARLIHKNSRQSEKPMITVNCTALSATLIESELFGYKKGAFTGAAADKTGLLELAHNGTIFLDEIGDMPLEMQSKLLRFLQSGELRPLGETRTRNVKVRVIAATNRPLEAAIKKQEFRTDLFYRLNAFTIQMPPLRQRKEDIPLLVFHFLKSAQAKVNKHVDQISPAALAVLAQYHWPGNLREMENVIERAVVLTHTNVIDVQHLPLILQPDSQPEAPRTAPENGGLMELKAQVIDKFEYESVCRFLSDNGGNVSRAAEAAEVPRRTFQRLMSKHKISPDVFREQTE